MPTSCSKKSQSVHSKNSAIKSKSAASSITSKTSSADITARRAALLVETASMDEKEALDKQMLALQQKAKRLELKTELEKLQAV